MQNPPPLREGIESIPIPNNFPVELILLVAEEFDASSLNSLLQTNRFFAVLLTPLLHRLAVEDKDTLPALKWAAFRGYAPLVQLLLKHGHDIDTGRDLGLGNTPLCLAALCGHNEAFQILLENGAKGDTRVLLIAAKNGQDTMVRLLLEKRGPDLNIDGKDEQGNTPLLQASGYHWDVLDSLWWPSTPLSKIIRAMGKP